MSSEWINEYAIMRDLAMVQGCAPISLAGTLGAGEKPPAPRIIEVTEEEFFCNCIGDGRDVGEPDLNLISYMLEMMRNTDDSSDSDEEIDEVLKTSRLNPEVPEFKPRRVEAGRISAPNDSLGKLKKKRNVAIASLLEKNLKENSLPNKINSTFDASQKNATIYKPLVKAKSERINSSNNASSKNSTITSYNASPKNATIYKPLVKAKSARIGGSHNASPKNSTITSYNASPKIATSKSYDASAKNFTSEKNSSSYKPLAKAKSARIDGSNNASPKNSTITSYNASPKNANSKSYDASAKNDTSEKNSISIHKPLINPYWRRDRGMDVSRTQNASPENSTTTSYNASQKSTNGFLSYIKDKYIGHFNNSS